MKGARLPYGDEKTVAELFSYLGEGGVTGASTSPTAQSPTAELK